MDVKKKMEICGVHYVLRGRTILKEITGYIPENRLTGLVGPNGAGKSTLLRLMGGLRRPSSGTIFLEGKRLSESSGKQLARQIAILMQNPSVGFGFTVEQVVTMGRHPFLRRLQPLTAHCREVVEEAMAATDVLHLKDRLITELSGGEQQRVYLARALAQEPSLLLLDEPTANLDVRFQLELFDLIQRLQRERSLTVVMALHDLSWALRYCHHVLVLRKGEVAASGVPEKVLTPELLKEVFGVKGNRIDGAFGPLVDLASL